MLLRLNNLHVTKIPSFFPQINVLLWYFISPALRHNLQRVFPLR
jgi:hypothetical protein